MKTDGLSDNVFPADLVAICSLVTRSGGSEDTQVQMMADRIVEYAQVCMRDRRKMSPFSRKSCLRSRGPLLIYILLLVLFVR